MKPFNGITVIELSTMVTASFASMMLAEQGARVIKVEPIELGDPLRYLGTSKGGISALFANCNRGKESVRVNLKDPQGQLLVARMIEQADIVLHNYRPGVMDKLNLGSDAMRKANPRLIYLAISGFGQNGSLSGAPAYDPVIQAHAGFTTSQGGDKPTFIRNLMCDKITAYTACQAVTAALYVREKTGEGQHIDLSMLDSGLFFMFPDGYMNNTLLDDDVEVQMHLADMIYDLTVTKDGAICFSTGTEQQQLGVLKALSLTNLMHDPRFNSPENLMANYEVYVALHAQAFAELSTDEALALLKENDVPAARCYDYEQAIAQEQVVANNSIEVRDHPIMGSMRVVRSPARFARGQFAAASHAPAHGEHTESVLKKMGVDEQTLAAHKEQGVVL